MHTDRLTALRMELDLLGRMPVVLKAWDPFILGATGELASEVLPAREVARRELVRCSSGRFPSLAVAIADAVFSKQREYETAVREATRPFATAFARMALAEFLAVPRTDVFMRTYNRAARPGKERQHLSPEGRIRTIIEACQTLESAGVVTPEAARLALAATADRLLALRLETVFGLKGAMLQNICMNVGVLTVKADLHLRPFLAPYLGLPTDAPAAAFEEELRAARSVLRMEPFEVDQIVWYTHAQPGCANGSS